MQGLQDRIHKEREGGGGGRRQASEERRGDANFVPQPEGERIKIGEFWDGRISKKWVPITKRIDGPQPYPIKTDSWRYPQTELWVGMASFRDPRCGITLKNMYTKAKYPHRIMTGVVQQNEAIDEDCLDKYCELMEQHEAQERRKVGQKGVGWRKKWKCPYRDNIRMLRVEAADAHGPCWGRHLQYYTMRDEDFCMQTDSHMDYVQDWDARMFVEWAKPNNEYAVLSTYVESMSQMHDQHRTETAHLCELLFRDQVRNEQAKAVRALKEPKMATTWGAGYSFSKCHAEKAVPYDPHLHQIFDGEEFSKFARLWTHGYDVYTPSVSNIGHDYEHTMGATPNAHKWQSPLRKVPPELVRSAKVRLWTLLGMPGGETDPAKIDEIRYGPYGLGKQRTLEQLEDFTLVDFSTRSWRGHPTASCNLVDFVPFDEDPEPMTENHLVEGLEVDWVREVLGKSPDGPAHRSFVEAQAKVGAKEAAAQEYAMLHAKSRAEKEGIGLEASRKPGGAGQTEPTGNNSKEVVAVLSLAILVGLLLWVARQRRAGKSKSTYRSGGGGGGDGYEESKGEDGAGDDYMKSL